MNGKKGQVPGSQGVPRIVYAHHYGRCNLSALSPARIINFFPSPEKNCFLFFQIAMLLPWLGSSIHLTIHLSPVYVSSECKWQLGVYTVTKGPQNVGAMEQQCESSSVERWQYHLWGWVNRKRTQWNYKAFSLLAFVINGSDIRQAVSPYLTLLQQFAAVVFFPPPEHTRTHRAQDRMERARASQSEWRIIAPDRSFQHINSEHNA